MIGTQIAHFRILCELGQGGMGVVYKARDEKLLRFVALKVLPPHQVSDETRRRRLINEARAAAAVSHPSVAAIHEIGEEAGIVFFAMEYVEGETLRSLISGGSLTVADALRIGVAIGEGLEQAHRRGVIHRDLKPENVIMELDGRTKILDFGLAKVHDSAWAHESSATSDLSVESSDGIASDPLTKEGQIPGTVPYMSPEQVRGWKLDGRSDLFSLGTLLYEIVTGRNPFRRATRPATVDAILGERPNPASRLNPKVPGELARVLDKLLAKEPDERYQSATETLKELRALGRTLETSAAAYSRHSVAVLPFADMGPDEVKDYFCEGMAEELINALTKVEGLRVIARTSAVRFKGPGKSPQRIGEELGVRTVLKGSVKKSGKRLRIYVALVSVHDGFHLWSGKYDREMNDVFEIQDEIASAIVTTLKAKLEIGQGAPLVKRQTTDIEAYHLYLNGRYHWNTRRKGDLAKAVAFFEQAIERDPSYALAHAGLADVYNMMGVYAFLPPKVAFDRSKAEATRALAIDEGVGEGHAALGCARFFFDWQWDEAEREFKRALELNPGYVQASSWYALLLSAVGRSEEAIALARRVQEIDPLSAYGHSNAGGALLAADRQEEALKACQRGLELEPKSVTCLYLFGLVCAKMGRYEESIRALEEAAALSGGASYLLGRLGAAYADAGRRADAERSLAELKERAERTRTTSSPSGWSTGPEYVASLDLAYVFAALGDRDAAFECLERAYEEHTSFLVFLNVDKPLANLRDDPRFNSLLRRMKLPGEAATQAGPATQASSASDIDKNLSSGDVSDIRQEPGNAGHVQQ